MRRRLSKLDVKTMGSTHSLHPKLESLGSGGESGIPSVEVKFVDIRKNTRGEGGFLDQY